MSKWWRKVHEFLPRASSLKKTASKNVSFVQKSYSDDINKMAKRMPESVRALRAELGKRAEEAASRMAGRAKALPSKAAEVREGEGASLLTCVLVSGVFMVM